MTPTSEDTPGPQTVQLFGLEVPIDRRVMSEKIVEAILAGRYEMGEAEHLRRVVRPGERVVEVGAGIGFVTALIARRMGAGLVVAIEANPALQGYIAALHRLNGAEVIVRQALVTPAPGGPTAVLNVHKDLWASSSGPIKPGSQLEAVEVAALSLAEIAAEYAPTLLIVDVEPLAAWAQAPNGPQALEAADFRPFQRVLVELKPKRFPPAEVKRVFDLFSAQGFAYATEASQGPLVLFERITA